MTDPLTLWRAAESSVLGLIEDHRAAYRTDLRKRLHQRDGEFGVGVPFAHEFEQLIDWDDRNQVEGMRPSKPGPSSPWFTARFAQWDECRRSHPEHHDRPEWRGSLCQALVNQTIIHGRSLADACLILGVTPPRAGRTLRNALLWIEGHIDRQRRKAERRQNASKPAPNFPWRDLPLDERIAYLRKVIAKQQSVESEERHDQGGIHAETCPKCRKNQDAA